VNQPKFESAPRRLQTTALVVANLSSFLTPFMSSAINVAMPSIAREFSLSAVRLTWVATAYMLTAAMFLVPFGRIGDIVGRKKIFALGLVVNTAGTVLAALSGSGLLLIVCRGLQGLGGAMIFGTGVAILTSVFPPGERGRALGINTAATYLGLSLGPVLGGVLVQSLGWRSIFWVTVPVGLAAWLSSAGNSRASGPRPAARASIGRGRPSSGSGSSRSRTGFPACLRRRA